MPKGAGLTKPMKLSAELADVVGKKEASRAECIKQLWAYIKKHNLQDPENKQYFTPDKKMAKVIDLTQFPSSPTAMYFIQIFRANILLFDKRPSLNRQLLLCRERRVHLPPN